MDRIVEFEINNIPLKYSRKDFIKDIENADESEYNKCGITKGIDGFDGLLKIPNESKIKSYVVKFLTQNETTFENPFLKEYFDNILKEMPEFVGIIGKQQHKTHAYTVDIHTIKTLQSAIKDSLYQELSNEDKTILKYSILLHDIGKKGGIIHHGHEFVSAEYAKIILKDSPIKEKIVSNILNHEWFKDYCQQTLSANEIIKRVHSPKIAMIMAKADLSNVNSEFHYHCTGTHSKEEFDKFMTQKFNEVFVL